MSKYTPVANSQASHADVFLASMRKANVGATYRIKQANRVNLRTNWCVESGFTAQAKEIRHELAKTKAASVTS